MNVNRNKLKPEPIMSKTISFILLFVTYTLFGQNPLPVIELNSFKWGIKDSVTGAVIVPPVYQSVEPLNNNVLRVSQDRLYGLINAEGEVLIEPQYEILNPVNDSLYMVKQNYRYGIVNANNQPIVPLQYFKMTCDNGVCIVKNGVKSGIIDYVGRVVIPFDYDDILFEITANHAIRINLKQIRAVKQGKAGLINGDNEIILPFEFQSISAYRNSLFLVIKDMQPGLYYQNGETCIEVGEYEDFDLPAEGLIPVKKDGRAGYINLKGETIIPFIYQKALSFNNGLAGVKKDGYWGVINKDNQLIVPCKYQQAVLFKNGIARLQIIADQKYKYAFINQQGKLLTEFEYDEVKTSDKSPYIRVRTGSQWGLIDTLGQSVISPAYDYIMEENGFVLVRKNKKYGLTNLKGVTILNIEYDGVWDFVNRTDAGQTK